MKYPLLTRATLDVCIYILYPKIERKREEGIKKISFDCNHAKKYKNKKYTPSFYKLYEFITNLGYELLNELFIF